MNACRPLELCAFLQGELEPRREVALEDHLVRCSRCAEELAWLRAERRLFTVRARSDRAALPSFASVMARPIRPRPEWVDAGAAPDRRSWRGARVALGVCAAAALLALIGPGRGSGERGGGLRGDHATPPAHAAPAILAEPLASVSERPRMTCLEASSLDESTCSADAGEPNLESASTPLIRRAADVEDEYGACVSATPASRAPRSLTCDAPSL